MIISVITADVVSSRQHAPEDLEARLTEIGKVIERHLFHRKKTFQFYRGDSFQALVAPEDALRVALLWKSGVKAINHEPMGWDIRLAVGIGEISYTGKSLGSSAGPALEYSGLLLDSLKQTKRTGIRFRTWSDAWTSELDLACDFAQVLTDRWTPAAADAVFKALLFQETQEQLAKRLDISQSSVHKRLQTANWSVFRHWEQHYRNQVLTYLPAKTSE